MGSERGGTSSFGMRAASLWARRPFSTDAARMHSAHKTWEADSWPSRLIICPRRGSLKTPRWSTASSGSM
eukprot:scaffold43034_cov50-Phaeocystis_antarctica.AAC.1